MGVDVTNVGTNRGTYKVLVGNPEGSRRFGRPRLRAEDNIKVDIKYNDGG
jgi:hypothetical protein